MELKERFALPSDVVDHLVALGTLVESWLHEVDAEDDIRKEDYPDAVIKDALAIYEKHQGEYLNVSFRKSVQGHLDIDGDDSPCVDALGTLLQTAMHRFDLPGALAFSWTGYADPPGAAAAAGSMIVTSFSTTSHSLEDWIQQQFSRLGHEFDTGRYGEQRLPSESTTPKP